MLLSFFYDQLHIFTLSDIISLAKTFLALLFCYSMMGINTLKEEEKIIGNLQPYKILRTPLKL